jgi:hypothetical protein
MRILPSRTRRGPLSLFAAVLSVLVVLFLAILIDTVVGVLVSGGSVYGIGGERVCAETPMLSGAVLSDSGPSVLRSGVSTSSTGVELCTRTPTTGQRILGVALHVPVFAVQTGALLLLWRLVRGATRLGPFSAVNVGRIRFLGWWTAVGGLLATAAEGLANGALTRTMVARAEAPGWTHEAIPGIPWTLLLTGFGLVAIAQIFAIGTGMRDDLEGTV